MPHAAARRHRASVHPHVCGEITIRLRLVLPAAVHPHVCGEIRCRPLAERCATRFTPTCVGKSSVTRLCARRPAGSPPRVWGNLTAPSASTLQQRFTPTCVGKSQRSIAYVTCRAAVHPHVCGEIRDGAVARCTVTRFTPTCVGKSSIASAACRWRSVHPHVCGEIMRRMLQAYRTIGSPPRVWGNLFKSHTTHSGRFS